MDRDRLRGCKREGSVREIGIGQAAEERARLWPHHTKHTPSARNVYGFSVFISLNVASKPIEVTNGLGGAADQVKFIESCAHGSEIAFKAAPLIKHPGVNDASDGNIHVIAAKALQHIRG